MWGTRYFLIYLMCANDARDMVDPSASSCQLILPWHVILIVSNPCIDDLQLLPSSVIWIVTFWSQPWECKQGRQLLQGSQLLLRLQELYLSSPNQTFFWLQKYKKNVFFFICQKNKFLKIEKKKKKSYKT